MAAAARSGAVTLVARRDEDGMSSWLSGRDATGLDDAAFHLAQTISARAVEVRHPPRLSGRHVGVLNVKDSATVRSVQVGSDPSEVARRLATVMRAGEWVGMSLRSPTRIERKRVQRWYSHRLGTQVATHHSTEDGAVVVSFVAGGDDRERVGSLLEQASAAIAGFDVGRRSKVSTFVGATAPWSLASIVMWAGALFGFGLSPALAALVGVVPALCAWGTATERLPSRVRSLHRQRHLGWFEPPVKRSTPPSRPRRGNENPLPGTKFVAASDGGYPLAASVFPMSASMAVTLVVPHAGASSGAATTERRTAPAKLLEQIGPGIGMAGEDERLVHLPAATAWEGVGVTGKPGSGKSSLTRSLWGWYCAERAHPSGRPGWPGERNTLVAFESKGDGAALYARWAEAMGDSTVLVEVGDDDSWAIDLFAVPGTALGRANIFTNAMQYSFDDGSIQDRSFDSLVALIAGGLVVTPEIAARAGLPWSSPIFYAWILAAGRGDADAVLLAGAIHDAALVAEKGAAKQLAAEESSREVKGLPSGGVQGKLTEIGEVSDRLEPFFGAKVTPAQRREPLNAPRNKLTQLLDAGSWWEPSRRKITWAQVIEGHRSVVVNAGVTSKGDTVPDKLVGVMASMLLYGLRDEIKRRCSDWFEQGRAITVFADELKDLASSSAEVVTWMRDSARSYGVRAVFATQRAEQLRPEVRRAFMSFGTFLWMTQSDPVVADEAAVDLSAGGEEWSVADIVNLEPHTAVLRTSVDGHRQPVVPVRLPFWEADMAGYRTAQSLAAR